MSVKLYSDKIEINGKEEFIYSGEMHYFRVPKADWKKRMQLWKDAGGNTIATYVPWLIHEPVEGEFKIDMGDGVTDISEFLKCAKEVGLYVVVRPGPYCYSELVCYGLPRWVTKDYPEVCAVNRRGEILDSEHSVSYMHPVFLEKVKNYFNAICPVLAKYSLDNGGTIILTQPDNELFGAHVWRGDYDFNSDSAEFGKEDGKHTQFLKSKFGSIEKVNARYNTNFTKFSDFTCESEPKNGLAKYLWNRDWFDFYTGCGAQYIKYLTDLFIQNGITTPFCHNAANPGMNTYFREAKELLGDKLLLGSDHYYALTQIWSQNSPTPQYFIYCYLSLETLKLMGNAPTVFEFPFGSCSDWPPITPEDMNSCLYAHMAAGVKGINGYILTGGPNPLNCGETSSLYDYGSPISAIGSECRSSYYTLADFGKFLDKNPTILMDKPVNEVQIFLPMDAQRAYSTWGTVDKKDCMNPYDLWYFVRTGLVTALFAGGIQSTLCDFRTASLDLPLLLPSDGTMSKEDQLSAIEFIKKGGTILFIPTVPKYDLDYQEYTLLADFVGAASGEKRTNRTATMHFEIANIENIFCNGEYFEATSKPNNAEVTGMEIEQNTITSWVSDSNYNGKIGFLGLSWLYTNREQHLMLINLLEKLGVVRHLKCSDPWLLHLRRGDNLFVLNLSTSKRVETIEVRDDINQEFKSLGEITLGAMETVILNCKG